MKTAGSVYRHAVLQCKKKTKINNIIPTELKQNLTQQDHQQVYMSAFIFIQFTSLLFS